MYIIKGLIRSTILYLGLVSAIREHSFQLLFLYLLILAANAVFCKLSRIIYQSVIVFFMQLRTTF